ncbi:MAG: hypothetical protein N2508_04505, partial [Anaerolineae bacterium]|nr:hypothetical protein [Anaerolineae bacterium]
MLTLVLPLAGVALLLFLLSGGIHLQAVAAPAFSAQNQGVALSPGTIITTPPGSIITFTHTITNTGPATNTFRLAAAPPPGWEYRLGRGGRGPGTLLSLIHI